MAVRTAAPLPRVSLVVDDLDLGWPLAPTQQLARAVRGAVVHDHELARLHRKLGRERAVDRLLDRGALVVDRHEDREVWHWAKSARSRWGRSGLRARPGAGSPPAGAARAAMSRAALTVLRAARPAPRAGSSRGRRRRRSGVRSRCRRRSPPPPCRTPLTASASSSGPPSQSRPVTPSITFSSSPPAARAITGRPAACASTAAIPNSSPVVTTSARLVASSRAASWSSTRPAKRIVGPGQPPQPAPVGAAAGHHERQLEVVERLDRHVDLLVRDELGEHQVVIAHRLRPEALRGHGRVDDARVAPEVGLDARLGGARVGHVAVHPLGGDPVPLAPAPEQPAQRRPRDRVGALGERAVALVPGVAERVVAVRDVHGPLVADHGVRPGARARDHHVVARQVERLDGGRVERQEGAEVARGGAHPLKERGVDVAVREAGLGAAARRRRA